MSKITIVTVFIVFSVKLLLFVYIFKVFKSVEGTVGSYTFEGTELYVRAVVTASRKHPNPSQIGDFECAWVQPVVVSNTVPGR